ncbi:hypothetical protein DPMN_116724 [Dreissena polymorpha]|nr:hypothetical protein DPMN_116724 [Dreissena polymorpha]
MIGQKLFLYSKIRKTATPGSHVIQLNGTIFELNSHIKETNGLTKFHKNWANNVTSRVFTSFHYIHIEKKAPPTGGHVFSPIWTIFKLKNSPPTGGHVFSLIWTIFELVRDINKTNVLTNFHDDWAKIVTSRVFTSHVIQLTGTIFELNSHIKETNVLTKKNAPPTGGLVFSPIWTIFKLVRDINKTNVLTNFHDYWEKIVTSRVFTRKTAPPTGGHVFQRTGTTFELNQHIIKTNILTKLHALLTKFHEDLTINVAS